MRPTTTLCLVFATLLAAACDRRDMPENAPTPQPRNEVPAPPVDPPPPTAPVEGEQRPDQGTPADPDTGT